MCFDCAIVVVAAAWLCAVSSTRAEFPEQPSARVVSGQARFTVVTPTLLRLEYSAVSHFVDEPSWFVSNRETGTRRYGLARRDGGALELDTGRMRLNWRPDGAAFHAGNLRVEVSLGEGEWVTWRPGLEPVANLGGTVRSLDAIKGPVDLGHGLIARDGWALVDDSTGPLEAGDGYADRPTEAGVDLYLFGYGREYRAAFRDLAELSGPVPLPRRYQLGSWYSRWAPLTSGQFRNIVSEYAAEGFPLDVLVMDMHWHREGWCGWSWDRGLLPDAEALMAELEAAGLAVTLNLHPGDGVAAHEDRYFAFMSALGEDPATGVTVPFDAGDRRYLDALYDEVQIPLERNGVDFWWLDWSRGVRTRSVRSLTNEAALSRYWFERTSGDGRRGANFSRWAGWGDHRHPVHFSGDAYCLFDALDFEVAFTATSGNAGVFFWSHDIGGFRGPFDAPLYSEIFTRWVQFGAVSAALRLHSYWDKRPWLYPEAFTASMRRSFELRARLFPYIYSSAAQSCNETWPLIRPMYLDHPDTESAYRSPTQFQLGEHLLAAPITAAGTGPGRVAWRPVWLPPGRWFNVFTGERLDGPAELLVAADLDEFPLYARGGVPLPMGPVGARMAGGAAAELVVTCWPGEVGSSGRFSLYEDDGLSREHEAGRSATTELSCSRTADRITVRVEGAVGEYAGQLTSRSLTVQLPATARPTAASVDGVTTETAWDAAARLTRVSVPSRSIRTPVTVVVWVDEADQAALGATALGRRLEGVTGEAGIAWETALARPGLEEETRNALLALKGWGVVLKNEGPTLYKGPENLYAYGSEPVVAGVKAFRRSGFEADDCVVEAYSAAATGLPLALDVSVPAEVRCSNPAWLGEQCSRGVAVSFAGVGESRLTFKSEPEPIVAWWVAGPYPYDVSRSLAEQSFPPETEPVRPIEASGPDGRPDGEPAVSWQRLTAGDDGVLDLSALSGGDSQLAYASVQLRSGREQRVELWIASDDGAVVWVNGHEVYRFVETRSLTDPERVVVPFVAGSNRVLVKVGQHLGAWKLRLAVVSEGPLVSLQQGSPVTPWLP